MLKQVVDVKEGMEGKAVSGLNGGERMWGFVVKVVITTSLYELKTRLQGKYQLMDAMLDHVTSLEMKSRLWETHLRGRTWCIFRPC